jgi:hypothetical protein
VVNDVVGPAIYLVSAAPPSRTLIYAGVSNLSQTLRLFCREICKAVLNGCDELTSKEGICQKAEAARGEI